MIFLSCGMGVQTTCIVGMACENKIRGYPIHPHIPIYDGVIFCDTGKEPVWVYEQVKFVKAICKQAGIPCIVLKTNLYQNFMNNFGYRKYINMPFWTLDELGKRGKLRRSCTRDYKIDVVHKFVRYRFLNYSMYESDRPEDIGAHQMHIGFSVEEQDRIFDSYDPIFVNKFPLTEMGYQRMDCYKYTYETWGMKTMASSCIFCPYHTNYFFKFLKENYASDYEVVLKMDSMLEQYQPYTNIINPIYISHLCKRIRDLTNSDYMDKKCFTYKGQQIYTGF